MPDRGLRSVCVALSLALMIPVAFAPACATAQSGDDQAIQSAAKRGVYRDLSANESRMAATRQDKAQIAAAIARANALLDRASPAVRTWEWDEARQQSRGLHTDQPASAAARNRFGNARTRDGGKSFDVLRDGLPQQDAYDLVYRHALAIDASGDRLAFGSTTGGVWITENQGDHWKPLPARLPMVHAVTFAGD